MLEKIILCATSQQLTAGIWQSGRLRAFHVLQNDEQGHAEFTSLLRQYPGTSIYMLADAVEEDFRLESLPHTSGNARRELVQRKLKQIYRSVAYRTAYFVNREKDKRKDDRFLFVALTNAEFLQGWVACMLAEQAPLVGVYLLSMMSEVLAQRLKLTAPHLLLIEQLNSGLRQTYLHQGRLSISRLAPVPADMQDRLAYFYHTETEKTRLYLISQRFVTRETTLHMVMPSLAADSKSMCASIQQEQEMPCDSVDLAQVAQDLKLDASLLLTNPELLHMHLLANSKQPENLAPATMIRPYQIHALRRLILALTGVILLGGLAWAALDVYDQREALAQQQQAAAETTLQDTRYNQVAKNFPTTPIPSNDLQSAVEAGQALQGYSATPQRFMQVMSNGLVQSPEIQINRLNWLQTNQPGMNEEATPGAAVAAPSTATNTASFNADPTQLYEVGFVSGEIRRFNGDYRAALNLVNRLSDRLKSDAAVEHVEVLQAPVNVSSLSNLQGSTTDERTTLSSSALFKLKIILKREVPTP